MPVKHNRQNKKVQARANSSKATISAGEAAAAAAAIITQRNKILEKGEGVERDQQRQHQYYDEYDWQYAKQLFDDVSVTVEDQHQHQQNNVMDNDINIDIEEKNDTLNNTGIEGMQELEGEHSKNFNALVLNDSSLWLSLPPPLPWSTVTATIGFHSDGDLYMDETETNYGQLVGEGIMIPPVEAAEIISVKSTPALNFDNIIRQCSVVSTTSDYSSTTTPLSSVHSSRCTTPICDRQLEEMCESIIDDCFSTTNFKKSSIPISMEGQSKVSSSPPTVTSKTTVQTINHKGEAARSNINNKRKLNPLLLSSAKSKINNINNRVQNNAIANKKQKTNKGSRRRCSYLQPEVVEYLRSWMMSPEHVKHPYPTEQEKRKIIEDTGLEPKQLMNWFVNNRIRYWKPRVEENKKKKRQQEQLEAALAQQQR